MSSIRATWKARAKAATVTIKSSGFALRAPERPMPPASRPNCSDSARFQQKNTATTLTPAAITSAASKLLML